ncbi:MAG: hypothetical protein GF317_08290 [Candidatus Lokiarchaeota archaeon]|nr:hypothetical protein [Candidatus Lokiarchaeota archaeon]MBD3199710.1 hypothetical protein [Candidatus Lokiarchaeota archaeon]
MVKLELGESQEDYLKAIYLISKSSRGGWVSNSDIADMMHIKPSSVTNMLYKLKALDLIDWSPRKSLRLTQKGKDIAKSILSSYKLLQDFFVNILKIDDDDIIDDLCCKIEHHLTGEVKDALSNLNVSLI